MASWLHPPLYCSQSPLLIEPFPFSAWGPLDHQRDTSKPPHTKWRRRKMKSRGGPLPIPRSCCRRSLSSTLRATPLPLPLPLSDNTSKAPSLAGTSKRYKGPSAHNISCCLISSHYISSHLISYDLMSSHHLPSHLISYHLYAFSLCFPSCDFSLWIILGLVFELSCNFLAEMFMFIYCWRDFARWIPSCVNARYNSTSHHITSHHIKWHQVTSCYIQQYHITWCHNT